MWNIYLLPLKATQVSQIVSGLLDFSTRYFLRSEGSQTVRRSLRSIIHPNQEGIFSLLRFKPARR
jgi:hypothetical protein